VLAKIGANPVYYRTDPARGWLPDLEHMAHAVTAKTRALVLIDPNNPTGAIYPEALRRELIDFAVMRGLVILADEVYGDLGFDGVPRNKYPQVERISHIHTAGNSSGIVDGAALVLIGSESAGKQLGLKPRARVIGTAVVGTDPTIMLVGPAPATRKALKVAGLGFDDIDLFEVNEAFASVVMHFQKDTGVPWEKINVNGGAIAMGHPLGATGAMLIGAVLDELEARGGRYGVVTACVGGGMGIATVIERL
jgi:acetyl-CoA C-acetyltransferase